MILRWRTSVPPEVRQRYRKLGHVYMWAPTGSATYTIIHSRDGRSFSVLYLDDRGHGFDQTIGTAFTLNDALKLANEHYNLKKNPLTSDIALLVLGGVVAVGGIYWLATSAAKAAVAGLAQSKPAPGKDVVVNLANNNQSFNLNVGDTLVVQLPRAVAPLSWIVDSNGNLKAEAIDSTSNPLLEIHPFLAESPGTAKVSVVSMTNNQPSATTSNGTPVPTATFTIVVTGAAPPKPAV